MGVWKRVREGEPERRKSSIGVDQAMKKAMHFCAYQERSHAEVREKLYGFGLHKDEVEELMARLISENFLNEERYALAFAGGRFRMKQWGKVKIRQALKAKGVSDYCIKLALASIDPDAYYNMLVKLAKSKWESLSKERNPYIRKGKARLYLLQKGFEQDLVDESLRQAEKVES